MADKAPKPDKAEKTEKAPKADKADKAKKPSKKAAASASADEGGAAAAPVELDANYVPRLKAFYNEVVRPKLVEEFGYKNLHEVPRLDKVVLNMGVGEAVNDSKKVTSALAELALIAGQKPAVTKARKSIATFKVREGMALGGKVTLRRGRMYEFIDRLVTIALPRVRDFRGLNIKSFDGRGNYAMGLKEHIVFPELNFDDVEEVRGLDVIICTTARTDDEARALLRALNFPFRQ